MPTEKAPPTSPLPPPARPARQQPGLSFWISAGVLAVLAGVLCFVPLFNLLGYEFSVVMAFSVSVAAPLVARGAVRRRQVVWPENLSSAAAVGRMALGGWLLNLATLALPLGFSLLNALRVKNCNIAEGLFFFLLLAVGGALLWSAVGTVSGLFLPGRLLGGLGLAVAWLAVAARAAWSFYTGPQMDSYSSIFGWLAGPIMEEVLRPGTPLVFSRLEDLLWAFLWLSIAAWFFDRHRNYVTWRVLRQNRRELKLTATALVLLVSAWFAAGPLGYGRGWKAVRAVCDEETRTEHFVIHHPAGWPPDEIALLAEDHEFRLKQVLEKLELRGVPQIHSWVFPSAAEKRRLTGAGSVQFAKPWQSAMFLNRADFPHPVLKHELVHVVAGSFGSGPLKLSARFWFWQNVGLLEGLAVAVEWPLEGGSPHRLAAAMHRAGLAPPIADLFHPIGFWTRPSRRAYPLAGSFVRFLLDNFGPLRLCQAYRSGTLEGVYSEGADELITRWRKFLEGVSIEEGEVEALGLRLGRPGLFERICAHEISALAGEARKALAAKNTAEAARLAQRWLQHIPKDPDAEQLLAEVAGEEGRLQEAVQLLDELRRRDDLSPARRAEISGRRGDWLWKLQLFSEAREAWGELLAARLDPASTRLAWVKIQALARGVAGEEVIRFLVEGGANIAGWLALREAAAREPTWAVPWYLLGRQLFQQGHFRPAIEYLEKASEAGLLHPELAAECLRLTTQACFRLGDLPRAALQLAVLAQFPAQPQDAAWAEDWLGRISFSSDYRGQN